MRVFVTGLDGCVGGSLAEHLRAAGHEVFGTVFLRDPGPGEYFLDLTRPEPFTGIAVEEMGELDAVVHTAGIVDQTRSARELHLVNALGTEKTLEWAKAAGAGHFIQMSSTSVYGTRVMGQNRTEETPVDRGIPFVPYSSAKIRAEEFIRASGLPYTILRMPAVLGPKDAMFSRTVAEAVRRDRLFRCGTGTNLVSTMCAGNIGAVIERVLETGPTDDVYNCADYHLPWNDLAALYRKELDGTGIVRRLPLAVMYLRLRKKDFLLIATHSYHGAHYPTDKLLARFAPRFPVSLEETVRSAVASLYDTDSRQKKVQRHR
jgi:nucleoside-diphosphate-sugar epimerase